MNRMLCMAAIGANILLSGCANGHRHVGDVGETRISVAFWLETPGSAFKKVEELARSVSGANVRILYLGPERVDMDKPPSWDDFEVPLLNITANNISLNEFISVAAQNSGLRVVRDADTFIVGPECDVNHRLQHSQLTWDPIFPDQPCIDWPPDYFGPIVVRGTCKNAVTKESVTNCSLAASIQHDFVEQEITISGNGIFQSILLVPWSQPTLLVGSQKIKLLPSPYTNDCHLLISAPGFLDHETVVHISSTTLLYTVDCELTPVANQRK